MATGPRLVNKQFNSPIGLYSQQNIQETLNKQTQVLNNGAVGIDFNNPMASKPANLANSAVLRMLEEEEQRQRSGQPGRNLTMGWRKNDPHIRRIDNTIEWPPKPQVTNDQINMNNTYSSRFFAPIISGVKRVAWPPPPEENDQESQPEAPVRQAAPAKVYQSPALSRLIPIEQEFSPPQSKVYSPQPIQPASPFSPVPSQGKPLSPLPSQVKPLSPQPAFGIRSPLSPQPSTPTQTFPPPLPEALHKVPSQTSAFCRPAPRGFGPVSPPAPVVAKPFTPEPEYYPAPLSYQGFGPVASAAAPTASESPRGWAPVPSPTPLVAPVQSQFVEPPPATVTLRPAAPIHQAPPPLVTSQPATNSFRGGVNMRGDQKWPPQAVKDAVAAENEARIELAKGPACRPRKVKRDYSNFFAQNALPHNYPGYRAPPGTQHFEDMTGRSQY